MMNKQLSAIVFVPVFIQIHDHRILAAAIILKLVQMFFVKAPSFIQGIVKFISCNSCVTSVVKQQHKPIHQIKKGIFMRVIVASIQPVNSVTTNGRVVRYHRVVANTRWHK